jgi:prepilin-type N-terminal cleavage/methylation domain-containing protein
MLKIMQALKSRKGFTLMELIVVLIILAILIAALAPVLIGWINDARETALKADGRTVLLAVQTVVTEARGVGSWNTNPRVDFVPGPGTAAGQITTAQISADTKFRSLVQDASVYGSRPGTAATDYSNPFAVVAGRAERVLGLELEGDNVVGLRIVNTVSNSRNSDGVGAGILLVGRVGTRQVNPST